MRPLSEEGAKIRIDPYVKQPKFLLNLPIHKRWVTGVDRTLFLSSRRAAGLIIALVCASLTSADVVAQNTTWTGTAGDGEWNTSANWSNGAPQSGAAVAFGPSSSTAIHAYPVTGPAPGAVTPLSLASWSFPSGAPSYQFSLDSRLQNVGGNNYQQRVAYFDFTGAGMLNQSGVTQAIALAQADLVEGSGGTTDTFNSTPATLRFFNTASAGMQMSYSVAGTSRVLYKPAQQEVLNSRPGAAMYFYNQSTAGSSNFSPLGGSGASAVGGAVNFADSSTAGIATFDILGGVPGANFTVSGNPTNGKGGIVSFTNLASAGTATFTIEPEAAGSGGEGGNLVFAGQSMAGSATINVKGVNTDKGNPGYLFFINSASADHSTILNQPTTYYGGAGGVTKFDNTSTAGYAAITNTGSPNQFSTSSKTLFYGSSTAGNATINNRGSVTTGYAGHGETHFYDTSTAGNATIANTFTGSDKGHLLFHNNATGGSATITNVSAETYLYDSSTLGTANFSDGTGSNGYLYFNNSSTASKPSDPQNLTHSTLTLTGVAAFYDTSSGANAVIQMLQSARLQFYGSSTLGTAQVTTARGTSVSFVGTTSAGQGTITASGSDPYQTVPATVTLAGSSTLSQATVTLNGGAYDGAILTIQDTAHPAYGTIICNPGPSGGQGGNCLFENTFTASEAPRLVANGGAANGFFNFNQYSKSPAPVVGSIEGSGDFFLLAGAALSVGSLNTNTVVTGRVLDGSGSSGGSLTKTGTGTLSLNGICSYTGGTNVNQGALSVGGSLAGNVNVANGGTLKGVGTVQGTVTVAAGGTVAPGNSPGTLTAGNASFDTNAALEIECSDYATDHLVVTGNAVLNNLINIKILPGSSAAAFENEIITVGGTHDISGLRIGSVPPGMSASNFSIVQNGGHFSLHYTGSASGSSYSFFEAEYFTTSQQADPNLSGPNADPDHDGLTNGIEYALGLDPTNDNGSPFTTGSQTSTTLSGNPKVLTLSFTVPVTAPSSATLNVQQGTDLSSPASWPIIATRSSSGTWTTYNNASIVVGTAANGRIPVTVIGSQPSKAFMRVEVTLP